MMRPLELGLQQPAAQRIAHASDDASFSTDVQTLMTGSN